MIDVSGFIFLFLLATGLGFGVKLMQHYATGVSSLYCPKSITKCSMLYNFVFVPTIYIYVCDDDNVKLMLSVSKMVFYFCFVFINCILFWQPDRKFWTKWK